MKPIWTILITVVATAVIVGGGTYYMVNAKAIKDKDNLQAQITTLNTKVADTEKSLADAQALSTAQSTASATKLTTYTNILGNFSFDVPEDYIVFRTGGCEGRCTDKLTVAQKKDDVSYSDTFVTVEVTNYEKSQTLDEWNNSTKYSPNSNLGIIKIGGVNANKYDNTGLFGITDWRFTKGNFTYIISISDQFSDKNVQNTIANKIIDTFKFTQ